MRNWLFSDSWLYFGSWLPVLLLLPVCLLARERIPFANPMESLSFHDQNSEELAQWHSHLDQMAFLQVYDPIEPVNRVIYRFNVGLDKYALKPLTDLYKTAIPKFIRLGIANFFQNIKEIPNTLNNIVQLNGEASLKSSGRLLINTTLGMLGVFDPAEQMGFKYRNSDIGMTLAYYGAGAGPYLMIPVLGPSNLRDAGGLVTEWFVEDEINFLGVPDKTFSEPALFAVYGLNYRNEIQFSYDDFNTPFSYDLIRFLYTRKRELEVVTFE